MSMKAKKTTVATYLTQQLAMCGRSQRAIATDVGYENANVITMFKNGSTKVPYAAIGALSEAMGIDPAHFLRLALQEYDPALLKTIESIMMRGNIVSADEQALIEVSRVASQGCPIDLESAPLRRIVANAIAEAALATQKRAEAAVVALNLLPPNMRHT